MLAAANNDFYFNTLVDLVGREYVSLPQYQRIFRLARILAARTGMSVSTVIAGAQSAALNRSAS